MRQQLEKLSHIENVKFAIFCVNKVKHLSEDERVAKAIKAAENWVENPNEANRLFCKESAINAVNAVNAASDAYVTAYCAVASAASAAYNAAFAAYSAVNAYNAASAAANAACALNITEDSLFQEWMSENLYKIMEA
jgi:hypothetical protein